MLLYEQIMIENVNIWTNNRTNCIILESSGQATCLIQKKTIKKSISLKTI